MNTSIGFKSSFDEVISGSRLKTYKSLSLLNLDMFEWLARSHLFLISHLSLLGPKIECGGVFTFSKVDACTLLKTTLLDGCFSHF